jgi:predicted lysophospholipase L1 biosynthesis ABC-type transport system permease subunit
VEIAMLKSTGYRRRDLYGLFALETGLAGLLGGTVGTAAGVAVSFLVRSLMQSTFGIALPVIIDSRTIGAGILVGVTTSLIFGLLPIARASSIRPQAVLRELPERTGWRVRLETGLLLLVLLTLFLLLSAAVLQNLPLAALVVGGTSASLGLLAVFFGLVTWIISILPVPGVLPMPRGLRANLKLALRNVGRQRARTVTTLLALFIGVFAIGLVLVLGQDIQSSVTQYLAGSTDIDAAILASGHDAPAVEQELAHTTGLTHESISLLATSVPISVNGQPIATFIQRAIASGGNGQYAAQDVIGPFSSIQGINLAGGQFPDRRLVTVVKGSDDSRVGRMLTSADAGTENVLVPVGASQAPDFLKLGDTVTLAGPAGGKRYTVRIVGFYTARLQFGQVLADSQLVNALSGGQPVEVYDFYSDPATADVTLARIQDAIPSIQTYSLGDILAQVDQIVGKLTTLLVTLASLAMLAGFITIANSVALAMLERRREVGILKAVGHTSRSVLGEVLLENGGIGFIAGVLGMLLVAASVPLLGSAVFGFSFGTPAGIVVLVVASSTAACMLIAVLVAFRATRIRPVEVLRYE